MKVRRILTETPLARMHERTLMRSGSRRHKAIPFARFDRSKYPVPALAAALHAQRALALGEYTAVDLFARLASALALHGAPFDLIAATTRIPTDEIRHADLAMRMATLLAGNDVEIQLDGGSVHEPWRRTEDLEGLDGAMLELSAFGETLACALLGECRRRASDPVLRAVFASIVADEVHHARVGWYYLTWRAPQWTTAERQQLADRAGVLVADVETKFWHGRDTSPEARSAARALGVLDSDGQRKAVRAIMEDEIVPALDALGLGASHAWRVRRRGGSTKS